MATTYFFRDTASDVATADVDKALSTTRGASAVSKVTNTANGPISSPFIQVTDGAGGTAISWFTPPLNAVTIAVAASGGTNPLFNLRGLENNMSANATFQCEVAEVDSSGTLVQTVTETRTGRAELGTVEGALNFGQGISDTGLAGNFTITAGNRLRFRVTLDDATATTMATAFTASFFYDGLSGASGDSFITFTETITEQAPAGGGVVDPMGASGFFGQMRRLASGVLVPRRTIFVPGLRPVRVLA